MSTLKIHQIVVRISDPMLTRAIEVARRGDGTPPSRLSDVWREAIALGLTLLEKQRWDSSGDMIGPHWEEWKRDV